MTRWIRGDSRGSYNRTEEEKAARPEYELRLPGTIGRAWQTRDAVTIEAAFNYPGSPAPAFGRREGENDFWWPHARIDVSFEHGEIAERDAFIAAIAQFVEGYMEGLAELRAQKRREGGL